MCDTVNSALFTSPQKDVNMHALYMAGFYHFMVEYTYERSCYKISSFFIMIILLNVDFPVVHLTGLPSSACMYAIVHIRHLIFIERK